MARRIRTDKLTEETCKEVAYLAHVAANDETFDGRRRAAERLLSLLSISEEAKAHGVQLFTEVREFRQQKQARSWQDPAAMTQEELNAHIAQLKAKCERLMANSEADPPLPSPVEPEPKTVIKAPTERMRKAVEQFDALPEDAQIDQLAGLWGDAA